MPKLSEFELAQILESLHETQEKDLIGTRLVDRLKTEVFRRADIQAEICRKYLKIYPRTNELIARLKHALENGARPAPEDLRYTPLEGSDLMGVGQFPIVLNLTSRLLDSTNYEISVEQCQRIKTALKNLNFNGLLVEDFQNTPLQGKSLDDIRAMPLYEISAALARKILNEDPQDKEIMGVLKDCLKIGAQIQASDLRGTTYEVTGMRVFAETERSDLCEQMDILKSLIHTPCDALKVVKKAVHHQFKRKVDEADEKRAEPQDEKPKVAEPQDGKPDDKPKRKSLLFA